MYAFSSTPLAASFDYSTYLEDFIGTLDNLPSETTHLLAEIRDKDKQAAECAALIRQKERALFRMQKGVAEATPQEAKLVETIRSLYEKERALGEEKKLFASRALELMDRHLRRLDTDMTKVQSDWTEQVKSERERQEDDSDYMSSTDKRALARPPRLIPGTPSNLQTPAPSRTLSISAGSSTSSSAAMMMMMPKSAGSQTALANLAAANANNPNASLPGSGGGTRRLVSGAARRSITASLSSERDMLRRKKRPRSTASPLVLSDSDAGSSDYFPPSGRSEYRTGGHSSRVLVDDDDDMHPQHPGMPYPAHTHHSDAAGVNGGGGGGGGGGDGGDAEGEDNRPYCYCNRPSYGQMLGCDNENCRLEWFHLDCAGFTQAPLGKWYCRECTALGFQPDP